MRKREDTEEGGRERAREGGGGGGGEGGERGEHNLQSSQVYETRGGVSAISITCVGRNDTSFCYYLTQKGSQLIQNAPEYLP